MQAAQETISPSSPPAPLIEIKWSAKTHGLFQHLVNFRSQIKDADHESEFYSLLLMAKPDLRPGKNAFILNQSGTQIGRIIVLDDRIQLHGPHLTSQVKEIMAIFAAINPESIQNSPEIRTTDKSTYTEIKGKISNYTRGKADIMKELRLSGEAFLLSLKPFLSHGLHEAKKIAASFKSDLSVTAKDITSDLKRTGKSAAQSSYIFLQSQAKNALGFVNENFSNIDLNKPLKAISKKVSNVIDCLQIASLELRESHYRTDLEIRKRPKTFGAAAVVSLASVAFINTPDDFKPKSETPSITAFSDIFQPKTAPEKNVLSLRNGDKLAVISFVMMDLEGGKKIAVEPDGAIAKFGINSRWNPDVDVAGLTQSEATKLHEERYNRFDIGSLPENMRVLAFEAAVHNEKNGRRVIKAINNGASVEEVLEMRREQIQTAINLNEKALNPLVDGLSARLEKVAVSYGVTPPRKLVEGISRKSTLASYDNDHASMFVNAADIAHSLGIGTKNYSRYKGDEPTDISKLHVNIAYALPKFQEIWRVCTNGAVEPYITSGSDDHNSGLHVKYRAIDVRANDISSSGTRICIRDEINALGGMVAEIHGYGSNKHFHISVPRSQTVVRWELENSTPTPSPAA